MPAVQCPSEVWPETVTLDQREGQYPHRMWMTIPAQECATEPVAPDPAECGEDTRNPECLDVCEGELVDQVAEANVRSTVRDIREKNQVISDLEKEGKLMVAGTMYDIATGEVHFL